ncbi:MAG: sigma-70 family RNA polymerase sigma factor [Ruminococcaceae bacterium]|nr:sigma-70 family RNA polymerase sigma factor [Oscillospiraceae bacterium]
MEDRQIVDLYWARSESAITETDKKYGRYCHYIAYQILSDDLDAEEIVNDTYLKTWNTVPPNYPDPLKTYVGMISNQLALNRYDEKTAAKRGGGKMPLIFHELDECLADDEESIDIAEAIVLRDLLNRFIWSLPKKTRNIFVRRYWYASSLAEIAEEYGMKESAVAMLMFRTRQKLREFLQKEGF